MRRPQNLKKIFVVLLTRASCSVHATPYLSKSRRRFFKTNVVKLYYTTFTYLILAVKINAFLAHFEKVWQNEA